MPTNNTRFDVKRGCLVGTFSALSSILLALIILAIIAVISYGGLCTDLSSAEQVPCSLGSYIYERVVILAILGSALFWQYVVSALAAVTLIGFLVGALIRKNLNKNTGPDAISSATPGDA